MKDSQGKWKEGDVKETSRFLACVNDALWAIYREREPQKRTRFGKEMMTCQESFWGKSLTTM